MEYSYERFLKGIKCFTGESVLMADIGYETIELYKEEVVERYFSKEDYEALPNVCMVTAINYVSEEEEEYLMMDVHDETQMKLFKTIWLKDGESI